MKFFKNKEKVVSTTLLLLLFIILIIAFLINNESIINSLKLNFKKGYTNKVFEGLGNTFLITLVAFLMGLIIGVIISLISGSKSKNVVMLVLKTLAKWYVSIFRGTPILVQLLIIYFVIFASYRGDPIYVGILAFGLNSGAYVSEIIRGGINSVPKGQMEAGRSLGLSYPTVMSKIIIPTALKNCLPSLGNEFISLIKETSVVGFIGAIDLTLAFRKIANATYDYATVYIIMGITYFIIVLIFTQVLSLIEKRIFNHD